MCNFIIRKAEKEDAASLLKLIKELARYEKAEDQVTNTVTDIERDGFGNNPIFETLLLEKDRQILGMSLYYIRYSTWRGKILYLEDIIVTETARGKGYGKALMDATFTVAKQQACKGLRWQVLEWNTPAIAFYKQYGATMDGEWLNVDVLL